MGGIFSTCRKWNGWGSSTRALAARTNTGGVRMPDRGQISSPPSERDRSGKVAGHRAIEVAAGLVFREGKLLITQRRSHDHLGGLWEFPGGKREAGESFESCLIREL